MDRIISTIIPIFSVIILGNILKVRGYFSNQFVKSANNLVYHVAIPVMIFQKVATSDFQQSFSIKVIAGVLCSLGICFIGAFLTAVLGKFPVKTRGSFIQCATHGNLGYVGFAVAYYFLEKPGFTNTVIVGSFLILAQNFLSVSVLEFHLLKSNPSQRVNVKNVIREISVNPIILATLCGILFSIGGIENPLILDRALTIISSMALPLALFLIGASISLKSCREHMKRTLTASFFKLFLLPCLGFIVFQFLEVSLNNILPVLILLSAPSATISYVMAVELKGDPDFAATTISVSTLLSGLTYIFWLSLGANNLRF